jgi:O-antigen/teichoic acid export membrane protein
MVMTPTSTSLRRGGLALAVIALGGFLTDFLLNVGLTRLLPVHEYGDFKVAHAFVAFFGVAVLLGGDRAAPKALATPLETGDTARAWEYIRFYLLLALGLSALVIAVTWGASFLSHLTARAHEHHHPLAWMSFAIPLYAASAMFSRTVQSANLPIQAALPPRVGAPLLFLVLLALTVWTLGEVALPGVVSLAVASVGILLVAQWWQLRRWALPSFDRDPAHHEPRQWLATSVPMMAVFLVTLGLNQDDLYFLEILGKEQEVGHYGAAATAAHFVPLVQVTVIGLLAPLVEPALEAGRDAVRAARRHGRRLMFLGVLPVAVGLFFGARPILSLFGPDYIHDASALQLLVVANAAWAAAALPVLWLHYTGRGSFVVAIAAGTLAVDSTLNFLLIPRFGIEGAAGGTAVTMTLAAFAVLFTDWRLERRAGIPAPS